MSQDRGFLEAIIENPDDDTPRLIYADWLDDHDQPDRAEFIRVQCERTQLTWVPPPFDGPLSADERRIVERRQALEAREQDLLSQHGRDWMGPLHGRVDHFWFQRGLGGVEISGRRWKRPWWRLGHLLGWDAFAWLLGTPAAREAWHWIEALSLSYADDNMVATFVSSPHLQNITHLRVSCGSRVGKVGALALGESPHLARLSRLDLTNNCIGPEGAQALAQSPHLSRLTRLHLRMNCLGDEGASALAASPNFLHLRELNLNHNDIGEKGATALIASPHLPRRLWLHIHSNPCGTLRDSLAGRFEQVTWGH